MGGSASKTAVERARREERGKEWAERLTRYFARYGKTPSPARLAVLVGAVVDDRAVWIALLMKFGPELDPPFDKAPPTQDPEAITRRRRIQLAAQTPTSGSLQDFWTSRLSRYFAKYDPKRSQQDIRRFVGSVPGSEWADVWKAIVAKYGPEPLAFGNDSASMSDDRSRSDRISLVSGTTGGAPVERRQRCVMIVKALKHLRSFDPEVPLADVIEQVDRYAGMYDELWQLVEEKAAASGNPQAAGAPRIAREEWAHVMAELNPALDPFSLEDELDDHERRPGGLSALFEYMIAQLDNADADKQQCRRQQRVAARSGDLDPAKFWRERVSALLAHHCVGLTADEEKGLWSDAVRLGYRACWKTLVNEHGPEPPTLERKWQRYREYWVARLATLIDDRFGSDAAVSDAKARAALAGINGRANLEASFRQFAEASGGELSREIDESIAGVGATLFPRDRAAEAAEVERRRALLHQFYEVHDPSRLESIPLLLEKASSHPGGFERMWQLLQLKYEASSAAQPSGSRHVSPHRSPRAFDKKPDPPSPPKSKPSPVAAQNTARGEATNAAAAGTAEYWRLRAHVHRAVVGADYSGEQLEGWLNGLDRDGARIRFDRLERDLGVWSPPMLGTAFWEWRYTRLASEAAREQPLLSLPSASLSPRMRYVKLRDWFRGDGRNAAEAFEEFSRCREDVYTSDRRWAKHVDAKSGRVNFVGTRQFWEDKMNRHRSAHCPFVPASQVTSALDVAEMTDQSYEDVWLAFSAKCERYTRSGDSKASRSSTV